MGRTQVIWITLFLFFSTHLLPTESSPKVEQHLLRHILTNSSPFVRPVINRRTPTVVTFGFEIKQIPAIIESEQTMKVKIWIRMSWNNELTTWVPEQWGNIKMMRLHYKSVWIPDIIVQENIAEDIASGPKKYKTSIIASWNGRHSWMIPVVVTSSCIFGVEQFPFDRQLCTFVFTPWTYDQTEVDIQPDRRGMVTNEFIQSQEWDLVNVTKKKRSKKYACCANNYSAIEFTVRLHRKPLYYINTLIVPCLILMAIILFTFFLPPESGERVGVVITVLLVFAVYLEIISKTLPKTSTSTPVLSRFYIAAMAESALSIVATCCVLALHFRGTENGVDPIPTWARKYIIDKLSNVLFVQHTLKALSMQELNEREKYLSTINRPTMCSSKRKAPLNSTEKCSDSFTKLLVKKLLRKIYVVTDVIRDTDKQNEIQAEWEVLARVLDRVFFLVFLLMFVVTCYTIVFRH